MKLRCLISLLLSVSSIAYGQQIAQFSQWSFHQFALNPAHAGIKSCIDLHTLYRAQWLGFSGAPRSGMLTLCAPLKSKRNEFLSARHGIGLRFENDRIGQLSTNRLNVAYAGHFNFSRDNRLSLGIYGGVIQMGYDVRVYFNDHLTAVAAAFETKLFAKSYMESAGKRYYFLSKKEGSKFYTYPGEHAHAVVRMNFKSADSGVYPSQWKQRTLTFPFDMKEISVSIPFNVHRTEFYETIPQNEFDSYFSNPGDDSFREKLLEAIGPALQSISNRDDRIRFLHAMVCLGVDYATDAQQFGHEKFCMPEEFLRYAKADCEDRTFFLNYLYRNILGVKTIGLVYPGHMAMAVAMDHPPSGATMITHHGKEYVFCDPTYIGASVGDMPSQYQGVSPEIVE